MLVMYNSRDKSALQGIIKDFDILIKHFQWLKSK